MPNLNSATIRRINSGRVFHALRTNPGSSQRRLCALTQLDPSTVSAVINTLLKDGFIRRSESLRNGGAGRPEQPLQVAADGGLFIGVAIATDRLSLLACGLDGQPLATMRLNSPSSVTSTLAELRRGVEALLRNMGADYRRLLGIGIAQHGPIDRKGYLTVAPQLHWRDVQLGALMREAFPVPVYVENDSKAAALAESLFGACRGVGDFVFIYGGSGVGGALFLNGALYNGEGMAGELGHMKVVPHGQACGCGGKGCLEAYLSEPALRRDLAARGIAAQDMHEVAQLAAAHPAAAEVLRDAGHLLGITMANVVNLLHPRRLVIAGSLATVAASILPAARAALHANAMHRMDSHIEIIVSDLDETALELGGVAMAMEAFLPSQPGFAGDRVTLTGAEGAA